MKRLLVKISALWMLLGSCFGVNAQGIGLGMWRDHFPYKNCIGVKDAGDRVYAATYHAVFYIEKSDNSIQRLSKINGLSDIGISRIAFHSATQTLVIAYANTNIDLIKDGVIINISDIKRKQIIGNKVINNIYLEGNYAYLACGFGIVVLDIAREEIKDTYYIGQDASYVNVLDITQNDTAFFAATEEGLYSANINSPNLADFSYWRHEQEIPYPDEAYNLVVSFSDKIILNKLNPGYNTDSLFCYDGTVWQKLEDKFPSDNQSIEVYNNRLYVSRNEDVLIYNPDLTVDFKIWAPSQQSLMTSDAMPDDAGNVWIADKRLGLIKTWNQGEEGEFITLQSPDFSDVFRMKTNGDELWVVSGGYNAFWVPIYSHKGFYSFINEEWTSYNCHNGSCFWPALDTIRDFVDVVISPANSANVFLATLEDGVLEMQNGDVTHVYDYTNSSLQAVTTDILRTMASSLAFDSYQHLWVLNTRASDILSVKTNTDNWYSFNLGTQNSNIEVGKLFIDSYNQKWIIPRRTHSLIVFSDNGTIENTADDELKTLSATEGNGNLFAAQINCIAEDLDRELWIGTDEGIGVIYSPRNVFGDGNFDMQRITVEWDGYIQYLLETETITAIAVDEANRKWIGTKSSGVFLLSEDGNEQIHHFTTENSPLISDYIIALAINNNGEVFIGTDEGLVSYMGEATAPNTDNATAVVYPNPVPAGYTGSIAIKNLYRDANVKITDISGNVVYETRALGGQAIWTGYNFDGQKAHTGVYLVFASSEDGSVSLVAKILFIN